MEAVRLGIFTRLTVANKELHLDPSSRHDNIFHIVSRSNVWAKDQRKTKDRSKEEYITHRGFEFIYKLSTTDSFRP